MILGKPNEIVTGRVLVWFSCGATSAVASKLAIEHLGKAYKVLIVNCDTRMSEHPDNYRFSVDCEHWFGQEIIYIKNDDFDTVDDVFVRTRYMSGIKGARCTTELKKVPRLRFANADDWHVFGYTVDEKRRNRIQEFEERNPELNLKWILRDLGITKAECYRRLQEAGIELPIMYQLGFENNNCPGCVKASSPWYWSMVRKHFPEVFKQRCERSRELGVRLVEITHHNRIFLDELPNREFRKGRKKENLSCGPECGGKS